MKQTLSGLALSEAEVSKGRVKALSEPALSGAKGSKRHIIYVMQKGIGKNQMPFNIIYFTISAFQIDPSTTLRNLEFIAILNLPNQRLVLTITFVFSFQSFFIVPVKPFLIIGATGCGNQHHGCAAGFIVLENIIG
jgi:hypothetical protein